jgi:hypothetical protein
MWTVSPHEEPEERSEASLGGISGVAVHGFGRGRPGRTLRLVGVVCESTAEIGFRVGTRATES